MSPRRKHLPVCRTVKKYFTNSRLPRHSQFSLRLYFLAGILAASLYGCTGTRTVLSPRVMTPPAKPLPDPLKLLQTDIDRVLSDSIFISTHASIKIVSVDSGTVFYEHDSKALMNPASNIKLITSAAALSLLDTGYQFKTAVFVDDNSTLGEAVKNICLKGYGDPNLSVSDLDSLAVAVRRFGIRKVTGDIIVDDSFFDDNYWGAGWTWDDESDPDAPYINALSVNQNCIRVNIISNIKTISVSFEPATDFVTVFNRANIVTDSIRIPLKIRHLTLNNANTIVIEGDIFTDSQVTQKLALRRPEFYAGTLFKGSLRRAGISVTGDILSGVVSDGMYEIARCSRPIASVIENMNKTSDNLSAENLLKVLGTIGTSDPGSAKNGVRMENIFLSSLGMDTTKFSIADGSGVSRYNLLSSDHIVQFLTTMHNQPRLFRTFYQSLPVAGIDGTLSDRMTEYPLACNVRAKTGTLNGASCLSGYVQTRDGEMLAFSMMMQNFISPAYCFRQAQDSIAALLAGFSRRMMYQHSLKK